MARLGRVEAEVIKDATYGISDPVRSTVGKVYEEDPRRLASLTRKGLIFDRTGFGDYWLTREGWDTARALIEAEGGYMYPGYPKYLA